MASKIFKSRYLISSNKTLRSITKVMTVKKSSFDPVILSNSFGQLADVGCMTFISITLMKSGENL